MTKSGFTTSDTARPPLFLQSLRKEAIVIACGCGKKKERPPKKPPPEKSG